MVAAASGPGAHLPLRDEDGRGEAEPGGAAGGFEGRLRGGVPASARDGRGSPGHAGRTGAGSVYGDRPGLRRGDRPPHPPAQAVPRVLRVRPEAGGRGRVSVPADEIRAGAGSTGHLRCARLQDRPGRSGGSADLSEADRRRPLRAGHPALSGRRRRDPGGEGGPASAVLRPEIRDGAAGLRRGRGGGDRPFRDPARPGPWRGAGLRNAPVDAGLGVSRCCTSFGSPTFPRSRSSSWGRCRRRCWRP